MSKSPTRQDDADDRTPDARRATQHEAHDGREGDADADVADVEVAHHGRGHGAEQAHRRGREGEHPELGAVRGLAQAAGECFVAAGGDEEPAVGRAVDLPGIEEDGDDHRGQDEQPGELVLLHLADVERDAQPAEAARAAGQAVLGGRQDLDDGREPKRDHEHAVGVQV